MKKASSKAKIVAKVSATQKKGNKSAPAIGRLPVRMKTPERVVIQDSEALTLAQVKQLETRLLNLREELNIAVSHKYKIVSASQNSESIIKGDDAEVAEKQRASNAMLQELDILKHRLSLIQRALEKIRTKNYGICEETEEPIGFERLMVVPWARYCVQIQEVRERKLRDFRVSRLRSEA